MLLSSPMSQLGEHEARACASRVWHAALLLTAACASAEPAASPGAASAADKAAPAPSRDDAIMVNVALVTDKLTLPNGLLVVLHREPVATSAYVHVRYHVGSKDDPPGRSGLAHLFEHLMFQGSRHTGERDHNRWLEDVGGSSNASTDRDSTDYHEEVPASALPRALWLESDRMAYPLDKTTDESLGKEREVVKNEYRERYDNRPYGHVSSIARAAVFGRAHPYGRPTIGNEAELDAITLDNLRGFARDHYRPNNATLVVCAPYDVKQTRELVTKYFASIPPGAPRAPRTYPAPQLASDVRLDVEAGVDAPMIALAWPAPRVHEPGLQELRYGLRYFDADLSHRLVTEKKVATDVSWYLDAGHLGSLVLVEVQLQRGASTDAALSVIDEYLTRASRLGRVYPWRSFADHRTRAVVSAVTRLEGLEGRAEQILHGIEYHTERETAQLDLRALLAVKAADVGAAMEQFLVDRPRVTIVVRPTPGAPRAGRVVSR